MDIFMNNSFVYFKSITLAQKARELLYKNGISSELVKKPGMNGCIWGISYASSYEKEVKKILTAL